MLQQRAAGILLHVSSLPGKYGIGTLGEEAYRFVDLLAEKKIRYWQILPLVQTGYGDSPYQSVYSASGNPYFIDFDLLVQEGLLKKSELARCRYTGKDIDFAFLYKRKYEVLRLAFERFDTGNADFKAFVEAGQFDGYALFMALNGREDIGLPIGISWSVFGRRRGGNTSFGNSCNTSLIGNGRR